MIFTQSLQRIDASNPNEAIKKMVNHIKYIQEQLEYTLTNLDSSNISEIDIDKTVIGDSAGEMSVGSTISISGSNKKSFRVGRSISSDFEFVICGKDGERMMYMDSLGDLIITDKTIISTVDGGDW